MKKTSIFLCILSLIISCSTNSDVQPTLEVGYPHEWVFTTGGEYGSPDPSVAEYTYIYTNLTAMFRDDILKSYPLKDLVEEEHCLFYVAESSSSGGKTSYTIQLNSDKSLFLFVGPSSNKEEVHLWIGHGGDGDNYEFFIHKMPDVNGLTTVAIESVGTPGWYISSSPPGFNYAQNVVTLQEEANPESAPKWQCRSAK